MIFIGTLIPNLHLTFIRFFLKVAETQKYHRLKETFDHNLETYRDREKSLK